MPSNFKKLVRARMEKTGETYQTAARFIRSNVRAPGLEFGMPSPSSSTDTERSQPTDPTPERAVLSTGSSSAEQSPKGTGKTVTNLAELRALARQFHIDHVGRYDIAVDTETLRCSAVPRPWYTLRECGGKPNDKTLPFAVPVGFRRTNGKTRRVFLVRAGICIGTTTIARGRLTTDEALRFLLASAGCRVPPGCRSEPDEQLGDWCWGHLHRGGCGMSFSRHRVVDADLAHEREADVRAAVAAGKYPVLLSMGAKRAARFAVIEKPILPPQQAIGTK